MAQGYTAAQRPASLPSAGLEAAVFLSLSATLADKSLNVVKGNEGEFNVCGNNRTDGMAPECKLRPPAQMEPHKTPLNFLVQVTGDGVELKTFDYFRFFTSRDETSLLW